MGTKQTFRQAKTYVASRTFMQTDPKSASRIFCKLARKGLEIGGESRTSRRSRRAALSAHGGLKSSGYGSKKKVGAALAGDAGLGGKAPTALGRLGICGALCIRRASASPRRFSADTPVRIQRTPRVLPVRWHPQSFRNLRRYPPSRRVSPSFGVTPRAT